MEINQDDYIAGNFISRALRDHSSDTAIAAIMQRARAKLWMQIKDIKMKSSKFSLYYHKAYDINDNGGTRETL